MTVSEREFQQASRAFPEKLTSQKSIPGFWANIAAEKAPVCELLSVFLGDPEQLYGVSGINLSQFIGLHHSGEFRNFVSIKDFCAVFHQV